MFFFDSSTRTSVNSSNYIFTIVLYFVFLFIGMVMGFFIMYIIKYDNFILYSIAKAIIELGSYEPYSIYIVKIGLSHDIIRHFNIVTVKVSLVDLLLYLFFNEY
nr:hypothetical protein HHPHBPLO_00024 [Naegleria fowleri]